MAKIVTPAEMAARLRISPSRVSRIAAQHDIGTKVNDRMRVYSEEDIVLMQRHSTGVPGRPARLSDSLTLAAAAADERAAQSIKAGNPEAAETTMKLADHIRRLAGTHEDLGGDRDPVQVIVSE